MANTSRVVLFRISNEWNPKRERNQRTAWCVIYTKNHTVAVEFKKLPCIPPAWMMQGIAFILGAGKKQEATYQLPWIIKEAWML